MGLVRGRMVRGHHASALLAGNAHWHIAPRLPDHHPSPHPTQQRTLGLSRAARPGNADWQRSFHLSYGAFLVPAVAFTVAHGIFLAALGFIAIKNNLGAEARVNV